MTSIRQTSFNPLLDGAVAPPTPFDSSSSTQLHDWAMAQGMAIGKLKLFATMAKSVNDQQ